MKVQLDDKSKAEFIEHIAKDSITCWFDGDEFVMPSGQGRTARWIVLGKLLVWQHRQTEVDELQKRVDEQGLIIAKVMSIASDLQKSWEMFEIGKKLEQALKGGEA